MACEMFVLGDKDFRLPGLGSFLQTAASNGNTRAMLWGLATMVAVIVLMDQLIWRPVIAWADKFKFEQVESGETAQNSILNFIRKESFLIRGYRRLLHPIVDWMTLKFASGAKRAAATFAFAQSKAAAAMDRLDVCRARRGLHGLRHVPNRERAGFVEPRRIFHVAAQCRADLSTREPGADYRCDLDDSGWRSDRIQPAVCAIGAAAGAIGGIDSGDGTISGVFAGADPLRGGVEIAAMALMLLGTQWYILFNVIAGAMAIPTDLKEAAKVFRFGELDRWRQLILPGIFPYLVTGLVTASGGAWNASIIAEYFHFQGRIVEAPGLGSTISRASDCRPFQCAAGVDADHGHGRGADQSLGVAPLYRLASTRFKLET